MKGERGNMLILGIGIWAFVCVLLAGSVALSIVALERRELVAQADSIALTVADDLNDELYYAGAQHYLSDGRDVVVTAQRLTSGDTRIGDPTGVRNGMVVVTLSRSVPLAFVPEGMPFKNVRIESTSYAILRER